VVSTNLWVVKWSGLYSAQKLETERWKSFRCPFHCKPNQSGVSFESPGLQNFRQVPGNGVQGCQNHDARKAVSASLWFLKWSWGIFRPRSSKVSIQKVLLCLFHCKPRPSRFSLESSKLENIPEVPRNRAEVGQNYDARNVVSDTLWVLKLNGAIFPPRSSKVSAEVVLLCPFQWKQRPSGVSLESLGLENIPLNSGK